MHTSECLADDLSLIDIAYCFEWKQVTYVLDFFSIVLQSDVYIDTLYYV